MRQTTGSLYCIRTRPGRGTVSPGRTQTRKRCPVSSLPTDPQFQERTRASFDRQQFMATLGATLDAVAPGAVEISLPFRADLTQQHAFIHAGVVGSIADSACGYAAFTLMPTGTGVLTVEYKLNLLRPATGDRLIARGRVVRAGRHVTVCQADVVATSGSEEKAVALMVATIMTIRDRPGVEG